MRINTVGNQFIPNTEVNHVRPGGESFGATIKDALSEVNKLQTDADQIATKLATGESVEVHQAMLSMQKASMALQFTVQVRNKVIEAYQEIMRMQL